MAHAAWTGPLTRFSTTVLGDQSRRPLIARNSASGGLTSATSGSDMGGARLDVAASERIAAPHAVDAPPQLNS
ncbi:MAG: hypothetical protein L0H59_10205 [Tomitella sp.]|nr:hypothetical protein [Tomitella sp.]